MDNRQVFIVFEAVKSAAYFWINGQFLGYNQDSKTPVEFDITNHLITGENQISVEIYRWSDASYLECQDMWRLSGFEREVYLWSAPKIHIQDFFVVADLDENYQNGILSIQTELINFNKKFDTENITDIQLEIELFDKEKSILKNSQNIDYQYFNSKINNNFQIFNPKKWTAETPNLYQLVLTISNKKNE